jgi:hypothetical protein
MAKELCDCIDKVNKSLQEEFEGVYVRNTTNIYTGYRKPIIAAERRHGKGKKAPPLIPSFCPFCGIKYED